jgi:hypothetical protein
MTTGFFLYFILSSSGLLFSFRPLLVRFKLHPDAVFRYVVDVSALTLYAKQSALVHGRMGGPAFQPPHVLALGDLKLDFLHLRTPLSPERFPIANYL